MMQQTPANESSKLLTSSPPPPVNHATRPTSDAIPSTLRDVFQIAHGVGENIRGTILGAIDDWENKGEQRHHDIARQGRVEIDQALQRLRGSGGDGAVAESHGSTSLVCSLPENVLHKSSDPSPAVTGYETAPPAYHSTGSGYGTRGVPPDAKIGGEK
ncbi:hypothetical protein GGX14DRAFT_427699 [Mycena pura]|uniref:Uncharacterized protein n=1 Tax=Mycena pura TaxID=153505 RepID=A0AAD6YM83_9AGAR|nr:hypothetical protein GGX14DRAFT_427699 [Mycena pura]